MKRRAFLLGVAAAACTKKSGEPTTLIGAGATLPHPLYTRWAAEYARVEPSVRINYQPLGSGAGQHQIADGVVDFGAADEPLGDAMPETSGFVHVPATIGTVVVVCNLHGIDKLVLTPDVTAEIFLGNVTRWDDERVRALNPGVALPAEPIKVVYRAEGSGTSAAFTSALAKSHGAFRDRVGAGTTMPRFPVGAGARGSSGLVGLVESLAGGIGYVEVAYAKRTNLVVAHMDEISALSLIVVPKSASDPAKSAALGRFLWWAVHDGQRFAAEEGYVALTRALVARAETALRSLGVVA